MSDPSPVTSPVEIPVAPAVWARVVRIFMEQLGVVEAEVVMDANLRDLGADSLDDVELMMGFEEEFGVVIDERETEKIVTVGDGVRLLAEKLSRK